jgi:transposase-like protein
MDRISIAHFLAIRARVPYKTRHLFPFPKFAAASCKIRHRINAPRRPKSVTSSSKIRRLWQALRKPSMSRSPLRPASAPHTHKSPAECPYCGSHAVSRKGVRKKKLEIVQLWRCASCKRTFTPGPAALRNKTYPIRLVLQALTLYDLGYLLSETAKRLKQRASRAVSPSTIATWIGARKEHTTFRRLRAEASTIYPPEQTIRSIKLYHRQIYAFAYHRSKLALLRRNPQHRRFEALATFLENIPSNVPVRPLPPRGRSKGARLTSASGPPP